MPNKYGEDWDKKAPRDTARGAKGLSPDLIDNRLREQLLNVINSDPNVGAYELRADVVEREAQLQGIVDTLAEKQRAEELARSIPGIEKVDSAVAVSTDGPITDKEVEFEVSEELEAHPGIRTANIGAKSDKGTVTLAGTTDDPAEVDAAKEAASRARGVTKVISQVKIRSGTDKEMTSGEVFHSQVRNDREKSPRH
jgi:hyperosmotically inducible protein